MGRHIIIAFKHMFIIRFTLLHQMVEDGFHIYTHIRISILVDAQRRTGMLYKEIE